MRKTLTTALAAVALAGGLLAAATPASAEHYRYNNYRNHRGGSDKAAVAVAAGIAGLALGAALSSKSTGRSGYNSGYNTSYSTRSYPYSNGYGYDPRNDSYDGDYYGQSYGYNDSYRRAPAVCTTTERAYDRYSGQRVTVERRYAC